MLRSRCRQWTWRCAVVVAEARRREAAGAADGGGVEVAAGSNREAAGAAGGGGVEVAGVRKREAALAERPLVVVATLSP